MIKQYKITKMKKCCWHATHVFLYVHKDHLSNHFNLDLIQFELKAQKKRTRGNFS
jgi:hypothetical protein